MKFGKSKPVKKKKVKRSKKEREVLKATGGWGTKDAAYKDSDDEEQPTSKHDMGPTSAVAPGGWRRTQAADDKAQRVVERKWLKEQQQQFEAEMRAPLFEAPVKEKKPKNRRRKASTVGPLGDRTEDVGPDGRRKVLCIRRKKPLSDSEDDDDEGGESAFDNEDDDSALGGRLTAFQKLVKHSKAAAASAASKKNVADEHDEEGSGGSGDDDDNEVDQSAEGVLPVATANTRAEAAAMAPVSDAGEAAKLSRASYDRHFRAELNSSASSSSTSAMVTAAGTTAGRARLGAFSPVAGFAPAAVQKSFADAGDLERGNWLEVAAAHAAAGGPISDAASLALQRIAPASGAAGDGAMPPKLGELLHSAFDSFGDVLFTAPTPLPSAKKSARGGGRGSQGGTEMVDLAQREALAHVCRLVLTARSRVLEHDAKLRKVELRAREAAAAVHARGQSKTAKAQAAAAAAAVKKAKLEAKAAATVAAKTKDGKSALPLLLQAEEEEEEEGASADDDDEEGDEEQKNSDEEEDEFGAAEQNDEGNDGEWLRDQGFTRPRVLLLAPTRHVAWRLVSCLAALLGPNAQVRERERFDEEFGPEEDDDEGAELDEESVKRKQKPADWNALFDGNNDDSFKLGLQLTPSRFAKPPPKAKTGAVKAPEMKLFTDFYRSDIVVASPLGLVLAFNAAASDDREGGDGEGADESALGGVEDDSDGEGGVRDDDDGNDDDDDGAGARGRRKARAAAKAAKKQKALSAASDFLSSIESCVVFDADALAQQNWNHVARIFAELNHRPVLDRGSDYARVRNWLLDDDPKIAARYRQTVVLSRNLLPPLVNLFAAQGKSHAGAVRLRGVQQKGAAARLAAPHAQLFQRIGPSATAAAKAAGTSSSSSSSSSLGAVDELRFAHLTNTVLAAAYRVHQRHTLVFVPDYLDFVRIRQWLSDQGHSFAAVHEYSRESEVRATS
jgi:hypothetical protein